MCVCPKHFALSVCSCVSGRTEPWGIRRSCGRSVVFVPGCVYISVYRDPLSEMENFAWPLRVGHTPHNGLHLYFQSKKHRNTTMGPGNTIALLFYRDLLLYWIFLCFHCHALNHMASNLSFNTGHSLFKNVDVALFIFFSPGALLPLHHHYSLHHAAIPDELCCYPEYHLLSVSHHCSFSAPHGVHWTLQTHHHLSGKRKSTLRLVERKVGFQLQQVCM